jgi:hypothetical protein
MKLPFSRQTPPAIFQSLLLLLLAMISRASAEMPDISSVPADLAVPETTQESPASGKRVRQTLPAWEHTSVYHALYLPTDWKPGANYPVIVEWTGNRYQSPSGDTSPGTPEGAKLGYGITGGAGCLWISLPYVDQTGTRNVSTWWGTAPTYDPGPTIAYCREAVRYVCESFGGDSTRVFLAGFSRGAIACNYLGLHDDDIARLWRGFICYSHYDGVRSWPYPDSDPQSAKLRLQRLHGRPQFICAEGSGAEETRNFLSKTTALKGEALTFCSTGFKNHNDAWILRPSDARAKLREWFKKLAAPTPGLLQRESF